VAVIRSPLPHVEFTVVRNCWARDRRIGYKGRGLLTYLLSHAEGYKCSQAQMVRESADGREAVTTGLRELEAAGYLTRTKQRSQGRFAEDDYALADPFDDRGRLLPGLPETSAAVAVRMRESRQSGKPDAANPMRETRPIEEQGEKITPVPTEPAADGGGQLQLVEEPEPPTLNQRAQALAREHYDAVGGLVPFVGIQQVIRRALGARGPSGEPYDDEAVRRALAVLRDAARPVSLQTLGAALTHPETVGARAYRSAAGPYRDPDPAAYHGGF
jgi:hypothetical protein